MIARVAKALSHLLQMRGLKLPYQKRHQYNNQSHLLQMRGLKLREKALQFNDKESHLLQMRGLKPTLNKKKEKVLSRIFYRCVD